MILLKADTAVRAVFKKTIKVMEEDIGWNEIFVINNNTIILPGSKKSIVFNFDSKKVMKTVAQINIDEDKARLMLDNRDLENVLNMLLYIFGKWGQIKGLTVHKNYDQLKNLIDNVLYDIKVEVDLSWERCYFYNKSVQVTYEDVVELMIKKMLPFEDDEDDSDEQSTNDVQEKDSEDLQENDENENQQEDSENPEDFTREDDDEYYMGIWHKMVWKSKDISFNRIEVTLDEKKNNRIGKDFYISDYACPVCKNPLHMLVFPPHDELKIETDEKRTVLLARLYTCNRCNCFYTPRPYKMLIDSQVYELDFDIDRPAYEDYLELLGEKGRRVSNCNFNVYADVKKSDIRDDYKDDDVNPDKDALTEWYEDNCEDKDYEQEQNNAAGEFMKLDRACRKIEQLPDKVLNEINEKIDSKFYSDNVVRRYSGKVKGEIKRRKDFAGNNGHAGGKYSDARHLESKKADYRHSEVGKTDIPLPDGKYQGGENFNHRHSEDRFPAGRYSGGQTGSTVSTDIKDNMADNITGSDADVSGTTGATHKQTDKNQRSYKNDITARSMDGRFLKEKQKRMLDTVSKVKDKNYTAVKRVMNQIEAEDCPEEVKAPIRSAVRELMTKKGTEELKKLSDSIPDTITLKQYNSIKEKINSYDTSVNKSDILDKLESRKDAAESGEVIRFMHRLNLKPLNRRVLKQSYDDLKARGYKEGNVKPALEQINQKIYDIDKKHVDGMCENISQMSFNETAKLYDDISKEDILPQLKVDTLARIERRLCNMKKDENRHLVRKFIKDTGYEPDAIRGIYACNDDKKISFNAANVQKSYDDGSEDDKTDNNEANPFETAMTVYGQSLDMYEYPVMLCDYSKQGNGTRGFILTPDHIYYKHMTGDGVLNIRDVKKLNVENSILNKGIYADYNKVGRIKISGQLKPESGNKEDIQAFIDKLNQFIKYLKEKPESRKLSYMIHEKHAVKCCYRCGYVYTGGSICPKCGSRNNE